MSSALPVVSATARRSLVLALAVLASCAPVRPTASAPPSAAPVVGPRNGSVMVVGGGALGPGIYARFIELAGGPDAPIIDVPTAGGNATYPPDWRGANGLKAAGARNVTILHTTDRAVADADSFVAPLAQARGVWFEGGRQWHLVDSYAGTRTERAFHDVLDRGGVVGGTSAGASILASFLLRGAREGNTIVVAPGYLNGFGFLHNVAIDQHVVARDRLRDLADSVMPRYPNLLGISEDEGTAWVIHGDQAEIIGRNKAFVYGGRDPTDAGEPWLTLHPGDRYDLAARHVTHRAIEDSPLTDAFIDSLFAGFAAPGVPGASVLVAQEGRILVNRAYGLADVAARTPVTTRTNFRLASDTKQFTAAAILLLVKDGKLGLDESLTDVFPDFPVYGRRITIRNLLNHTSGLIDYERFAGDSHEPQLHDSDVLNLMIRRTDSTYFPPGSQFRYSNTGYAILADVVTKRGGMPFAQFLQRRIFTPVGMHKTVAFEDGVSAVTFRAFGHSLVNGAWTLTDQSPTSAVLGDGGVYSSVDELYRWEQAQNTAELLPPSMLKETVTPATLTDGRKTGYGFGWFVDSYRGLPRFSHMGSTVGFRNAIVRIPGHHVTIIILTNRNDANPKAIAERILDRLLFTVDASRWRIQPVASISSCRSLSAVSAQVAWAGCSRGIVFRTIDGGANWSADSVPGAGTLDFRGIRAFDANTAVITSAGPAERGGARIYRTVDGGHSWSLQWTDSTNGIFLDGLAFWDRDHGIAFSDPVDGRLVVVTTDDGGTHWAKMPSTGMPPVLAKEAAFAASNTALTVQGSSNAWIATGGSAEARVFRTTDRGRSWSVASTGMPGGPSAGLFGIAFADARNGLAAGGDYTIARGVTDFAVRTSDGGATWHRAGIIRPDGATQGLAFVPGTSPPVFVGAGAWGTASTSDFGATWVHGDTLTAWGIGFTGSGTGWVVGPRGHIAKFTGNAK